MSTDKAGGLSPTLISAIAVKVGELEYILRHGRDGNIGAASNRHKLLTEFAERIAALAVQDYIERHEPKTFEMRVTQTFDMPPDATKTEGTR